jgi:hypothetical protein
MEFNMQVIKFKAKNGHVFYTPIPSTLAVGEIVKSMKYECQVELLNMTEEEFLALPVF